MCGRYTLTVPKMKLEARFNAKMDFEWNVTYNAAPSQKLPIIRDISPDKIELATWGFLPKWMAEKNKLGFINARAETIFEKPTFKKAIQSQRCLIPADSFFEWKKTGDGKVPYRISLKDNELFSFGGIWTEWIDDKDVNHITYSIITTDPNELVEKIHERMPLILPRDEEVKWLDNDAPSAYLESILKPYSSSAMEQYEVSKYVNVVSNNDEKVILKIS